MAKRATPSATQEDPGAVRLTSAEDGLWACGQRHPARPVTYPPGWFSARQVAELQALDGMAVEIFPLPVAR
jgi:hypothetical protein